jgi:hypothetical protein
MFEAKRGPGVQAAVIKGGYTLSGQRWFVYDRVYSTTSFVMEAPDIGDSRDAQPRIKKGTMQARFGVLTGVTENIGDVDSLELTATTCTLAGVDAPLLTIRSEKMQRPGNRIYLDFENMPDQLEQLWHFFQEHSAPHSGDPHPRALENQSRGFALGFGGDQVRGMKPQILTTTEFGESFFMGLELKDQRPVSEVAEDKTQDKEDEAEGWQIAQNTDKRWKGSNQKEGGKKNEEELVKWIEPYHTHQELVAAMKDISKETSVVFPGIQLWDGKVDPKPILPKKYALHWHWKQDVSVPTTTRPALDPSNQGSSSASSSSSSGEGSSVEMKAEGSGDSSTSRVKRKRVFETQWNADGVQEGEL